MKSFLAERQDDWREGIAEAFRHFGGVLRELPGDNAKALVITRNHEAQTVTFHLAYLSFCDIWGAHPGLVRLTGHAPWVRWNPV